jgi:hypothetical protein
MQRQWSFLPPIEKISSGGVKWPRPKLPLQQGRDESVPIPGAAPIGHFEGTLKMKGLRGVGRAIAVIEALTVKGRALRCAAAILSMLASAIAAPQQSSVTPATQNWVTVHIAPQPLREALRVFADQTQLQVVYRSEQINPTVICAAVVGTYPAEEALARLLGTSDLRAVRINARTLAIHVASNRSTRKGGVASASSPDSTPTDPE